MKNIQKAIKLRMRIPMPQAVYGLCDVLPALARDGKALSPKYVPKTILCPSALKVVELHHPCHDQWISQVSVLHLFRVASGT